MPNRRRCVHWVKAIGFSRLIKDPTQDGALSFDFVFLQIIFIYSAKVSLLSNMTPNSFSYWIRRRHWRSSVKKMFLKISQIFTGNIFTGKIHLQIPQENTCVRVSISFISFQSLFGLRTFEILTFNTMLGKCLLKIRDISSSLCIISFFSILWLRALCLRKKGFAVFQKNICSYFWSRLL